MGITDLRRVSAGSMASGAGAGPRRLDDGIVASHYLLAGQPGTVVPSGHRPEVDVDPSLPTHPDVRHLRRVKAIFDFSRREPVRP